MKKWKYRNRKLRRIDVLLEIRTAAKCNPMSWEQMGVTLKYIHEFYKERMNPVDKN